ncbi:MAG: sugar transferase [Bacteroidales bacterium]|nr:sugar transferase [Candidatus Physcousia equi]
MVETLVLNIDETQAKDGMSVFGRIAKRTFDIVASLLGILLLSPLYLFLAIKVKRQKDGPVFYRQERIGKGGKPFHILKFRTMKEGYEDEMHPQLTVRNEGNLTRSGKLLRENHLDELPQLWNVLVGDMSFVGPRPERQYFIDKIMQENSDYEQLFQIRPGITSMATIYNGYTDTMEKMLIRLQMDLDYLRKRSLALDAKILFATLRLLLNGKKI